MRRKQAERTEGETSAGEIDGSASAMPPEICGYQEKNDKKYQPKRAV